MRFHPPPYHATPIRLLPKTLNPNLLSPSPPMYPRGRNSWRRSYSDRPPPPEPAVDSPQQDPRDSHQQSSHLRSVRDANQGFRQGYGGGAWHPQPPPQQQFRFRPPHRPPSPHYGQPPPNFYPPPPQPHFYPPPNFRLPPPHFRPPPHFHPPPNFRPPRPPDFREWKFAPVPPLPQRERFTVVSYNILADYLAMEHRPKLYYHVPQHVLDWEWRKRRLMIEFGLWNPDILCLQEVDKFHDIEAELAARGYTGIWKMRTGTATDGCAIFWRTNRFNLRFEEDIEFSKLGLRDNIAQICVLESKTENPFESASATLPSSSDQPKGSNQIIICNIHVLYNPKRGEIKLGQVRVLLERAYAVSRNWNDAPVILCGDFNSTPRSPLYNFIAEQKLSLSGLTRDQVSGQYAASNYKPWPYTSSGLYRPQPRVYKPSEVASGSEQGRINTGTDCTHQCEIGNASLTEKVPLSKRPSGELHTDAQSSPVSRCITGEDTASDAIANEEGETVTQDDECSESISMRNTVVPKLMGIVGISNEPSGSSLNNGNGETEQGPSVSCSDAFEEVAVANTAPAAAKEITSDKMSMRAFPDIVEVSSIDVVRSSDPISKQEDHLVISYKETSESSPDNFLNTPLSDTQSVDLCVNELNEITVNDSCPYINDGTTNSSRDSFRHVGGVVSLHDNGQPDYSAQSNSDINCQYQEKSTAYGIQNNQFDYPISSGQGDNEITDLCQTEKNSDPNFFKELLGTEDANGFREEAGVGIVNSASLHKSTSTASCTQAKEESSNLVGPHYAGQEANSYAPYNPYLWTPMEIEAASGKAERPFVEHDLKLKSAYTDVEDSAGTKDSAREPQVTSYNRQFMGTVDYIWYSEGLQTVKVLDTIPKHVLQRTPGFPTQKWGSDHIALACQFSITKG